MRNTIIFAAAASFAVSCLGISGVNAMMPASSAAVRLANESLGSLAPVHCRPYRHWHPWGYGRGCHGGGGVETDVMIRHGHGVRVHEGMSSRTTIRGMRVHEGMSSRTTIRGMRVHEGMSSQTTVHSRTGTSNRGEVTTKSGTSTSGQATMKSRTHTGGGGTGGSMGGQSGQKQ